MVKCNTYINQERNGGQVEGWVGQRNSAKGKKWENKIWTDRLGRHCRGGSMRLMNRCGGRTALAAIGVKERPHNTYQQTTKQKTDRLSVWFVLVCSDYQLVRNCWKTLIQVAAPVESPRKHLLYVHCVILVVISCLECRDKERKKLQRSTMNHGGIGAQKKTQISESTAVTTTAPSWVSDCLTLNKDSLDKVKNVVDANMLRPVFLVSALASAIHWLSLLQTEQCLSECACRDIHSTWLVVKKKKGLSFVMVAFGVPLSGSGVNGETGLTACGGSVANSSGPLATSSACCELAHWDINCSLWTFPCDFQGIKIS